MSPACTMHMNLNPALLVVGGSGTFRYASEGLNPEPISVHACELVLCRVGGGGRRDVRSLGFGGSGGFSARSEDWLFTWLGLGRSWDRGLWVEELVIRDP